MSNDLQSKAEDVANELMGRYAYLIRGADPDNLRLLLKHAFFEGRSDGLEAARKAYAEATAAVLGEKK